MKGGIGANKNLEDALDYIATNYILTMDFQSLRKLYDKKYCNDLVVLTSEIINRYFTELEISKLVDRVANGSAAKNDILFANKSDLEKLIKTDANEDSCNYIAKFYIKIAHIFAAILMTINPEYVFTDSSGKKGRRKLSEKGSIPSDAVIERVNSNLCQGRIDALKGEGGREKEGEEGVEGVEGENDKISVKPKICSSDIYTRNKGDSEKDVGSLNDIPGIPELMELYYDADYDYETGEFRGMTEETQKIFREDLLRFYKVFTGKPDMPEDVKKFSDIKLHDYSKNSFCNGDHPLFEQEIKGSIKNKLFADYANNLKQMLASVNEKQQQLLEIINKLFVYVKDSDSDSEKEVIRVNPELNEEKLQQIIEVVRSTIVELYLKCESDYLEGVKLYEAIIEAQILQSSQNQIATLKEEVLKLFS